MLVTVSRELQVSSVHGSGWLIELSAEIVPCTTRASELPSDPMLFFSCGYMGSAVYPKVYLRACPCQAGSQNLRFLRVSSSRVLRSPTLAERLVGAEPHDSQTQRIDRELVVPDVFAENIRDGRRPALAFHFAVVGGIGVHFFELDASRIRGLAQVVKDDILDFHVDKGKATIPDITLDEIVLPLLVDHRALNIAIQKVQ